MKHSNFFNLFVLLCFFVSGAAGLIYQVCWIRSAALIFGSTIFALSTVLAVYFAGMAVGSYLSGRFSLLTSKPLFWYALLEIALALYALFTPLLFGIVNNCYDLVFGFMQSQPVFAIAARVILVLLVLFIPAILLGASLPLFCRQMVTSNKHIANKIGLLYTFNTFGAAIGCLLAGFYLIPALGVTKSIIAGAVLSSVAGLIAFYLLSHYFPGSAYKPVKPLQSIRLQPSVKPLAIHSKLLITGLFFLTGFIVIGNEVIWTRFLGLLIRNTIYTYTITLCVVLFGIALGSLLASRLFDKFAYLKLFGYLQIISALLNMALMLAPPTFWKPLGTDLLPYIVLMLVPALISGLCFPLIMRLVSTDALLSAVTVGSMTAYNIFGGVLGSLVVGFLILPELGLQISVLLLSAAGVVCGCVAMLYDQQNRRKTLAYRWTAICVVAIGWLSIALLGAHLPADYLGPENLLIDYQEGYGALLSAHHKGETKILQSDRLWQGTNIKNHQIMVAHVPMILHSNPKQVLVVGLGVGQTASRFLMYDIKQLDIVDIEPALFEFVQRNFDTEWMTDRRVHLLAEDGRLYIDHTVNQYDVISVEVGQVFRPGTDVFYTLEFYQHARERLKENGLIAQFVPLAFFGETQFQRVLATFQSVFPESVLWYNTQEMLLIGSVNKQIKLKPERLALLKSHQTIKTDLQYSYWGGIEDWLYQSDNFAAGFISGKTEIQAFSGSEKPYVDDHPELAYATSQSYLLQRNERNLAKLLVKYLAPVSTIFSNHLLSDKAAGIERQRFRNLNNLSAETYLADAIDAESSSDPEKMLALINRALELNPDNFMANRMKATALMHTREPGKAVIWFKKAIELNPENRIARRGLALAYLQSGHFFQAIKHARIALGKKSDDAIVLRTLGLALASTNQIKEGAHYLQKSVDLDPENIVSRNALSLAKKYLTTTQ